MASGKSLHIGVNKVDPAHYQGWSGPLNACEYDAEDMKSLAESQGFATEILLTSKATRKAVIDGIRGAASKLAGGDILLLTYSGHGGQVGDYNRDEPDNKDETWCLYDGQLIDDELYKLWSEFKPGVRVLVLSDSCHSGTVIRVAPDEDDPAAAIGRRVAEAMAATGARFRYMPQAAAGRTYRANKSFYDELQKDLPKQQEILDAMGCSVRLISGCQDNQYSLDGDFNGLFTGTLLRVWDQGAFSGDYDRFHAAIVQLMPSTQTPNHFRVGAADAAFDGQSPFAV